MNLLFWILMMFLEVLFLRKLTLSVREMGVFALKREIKVRKQFLATPQESLTTAVMIISMKISLLIR